MTGFRGAKVDHKLRTMFIIPLGPAAGESFLRVISVGNVTDVLSWLAVPTFGVSFMLAALFMRREIDTFTLTLPDKDQLARKEALSEEFGMYALAAALFFAGYVIFEALDHRHLMQAGSKLNVLPICLMFFFGSVLAYAWTIVRSYAAVDALGMR